MDIQNAIIIKTQTHEQTEKVKSLREQLMEDIILVPHGVTDLFITIEQGDLIVILQKAKDGWDPIDLDVVKRRFQSVKECWEYAHIVMKEAGLPEDSCDADVRDIDTEN